LVGGARRNDVEWPLPCKALQRSHAPKKPCNPLRTYAQVWTVRVLTLTDPQGRPLARRSFAPSEYLGDPVSRDTGIPAYSEQPLVLPLTVRDLKVTH